MLKNGGHLHLNHMGEILILPMSVHNIESYMVNILSFAEFSNIAGAHINMYTSKENFINSHIKDGKNIHFKAFAEGHFKNINDQSMVTNPTNVSINSYSYLILKLNE